MGLKEVFKSSGSGGHRCETDENGVHHCQIYKKDKEGKMATGTDITFSIDKDGCGVNMIGGHDINDEDQEKVNKIIAQRVNACRKGL